MQNIILCGGNGTRLWPISRTLMPKQFVKILNNHSLFQLTLKRNSKFCENSFIVSNSRQYFLAIDQLEELNIRESKFLLEPIGRDTAPAIALACMALYREDIVLVTPSDHLIGDEVEYEKVLNKAKELAKDDYLVTFGITPTSPETGFGYIKADNYDVEAFYEKPNRELAKKYLEDGNYYWNSGMFCFKVGVFLDELNRYAPKIYDFANKAYSNRCDDNPITIEKDDMLSIPKDSIDYAVMEKSKRVKVVPSDIKWSDLGSFDALYSELEKDENGNTVSDRYIQINSHNNLIYSKDRYISTIDIEDLIIVDTPDALLISKRGSSQKVKEVVEEVKRETNLHEVHLTTHRPWGTYTVLQDRDRYKIKTIVVEPNKRLSLQKHFHRSEHWIVVSGTATVTVGDKRFIVRPNESTYIKMGEVHRLENEGKIPVVLIEAQVGEYTGEDDIVRIEDDFKRV